MSLDQMRDPYVNMEHMKNAKATSYKQNLCLISNHFRVNSMETTGPGLSSKQCLCRWLFTTDSTLPFASVKFGRNLINIDLLS